MVNFKSQRARKLLETPKAFVHERAPGMRLYEREGFKFYIEVITEGHNVKKLSFTGQLEDWRRVLLESMASLMAGKDLTLLDQLTLRECEAFLRDRNSESAVEGMPGRAEQEFRDLFDWMRRFPWQWVGQEYVFPSDKGPFRNLKLADKVRELKGFLNSSDVLAIYENERRPELLDIEELTVYLDVPYEKENEKDMLDKLHSLGVITFQEENLNFIPEG